MIQIETVHIEELRGIRALTLQMDRKNFVISGPNGSGKSGVVDAIQFALTGEIGRLKGTGTGDLSLSTHGPHVDKRDYPDAAFVRLDVFIPSLAKRASITRKIRKPSSQLLRLTRLTSPKSLRTLPSTLNSRFRGERSFDSF